MLTIKSHTNFITYVCDGMYGNCSKSHNKSYKIISLKILKHYNWPRIVSTQMKFTQKVKYFTVFKRFPSTSCCLQKFSPNKMKKLACWTCEAVSGMIALGERWGMEWWTKVIIGHE